MKYIVWFEQIDKDSGSVAGGKGANLGELVNLGLPVPEGFVITTKAFDTFLYFNNIADDIRKMIAKCDVENTDQLLKTSKEIKELIISSDIPLDIKNELVNSYQELSFTNQIITPEVMKLISAGREYALVAIRSSATSEDLPNASFAGQQASFLNTKGIKRYLEAVKKCWASLYEPRAIFYRAKHGVTHTSIAVIVQRMVNSEKSGVMFTINPVNGKNETVIEATWGLGETLVQGEVEPDLYRISKDGRILEKTVGKKQYMRLRDLATDETLRLPVAAKKVDAQVLTEEEITSLTEYGDVIEKHYQTPQDIEFATEKDRIYILQTRAVTTEVTGKEVEVEGEILVKGLGSSPGIASGTVKIVRTTEDLAKVKEGDVLVTTMTSPDMVVTMSRSVAIVTDSGGTTCHASIVGREMGLPVIVGTNNATQVLKDGQEVTVDAYNGAVYAGRKEIEGQPKVEETREEFPVPQKSNTQIKVNLAFPKNLDEISKKADGVGLLRIEHMITRSGIHPAKLVKEGKTEQYINILMDGIRPIAKAFHPKPVWVRTLDARTDEFRNLEGGREEPKEDNPMLGWHGIRRSLDQPELLKAEFEAVKRLHEEGLNNVHVMLPFVISVNEFRRARQIADEIGLPEECDIGIMVETPAAALTIRDFCKAGIDFVSFGTNDLSQLVLGVDRNNAQIAGLFNETHVAIRKLVKYVIKVCQTYNVETSICGEAPSNIPRFVEFLVNAGINSISVNIDAIDKVRSLVTRSENRISRTI